MITLQKPLRGKGYFILAIEKSGNLVDYLTITPQELLDLLKILEERKGEIEKEIEEDR